MINTNFTQLIHKYLPKAILKGGELLLPPKVAIDFAEEIAAIGIVIEGVDGWKLLDASTSKAVQDLSVDFYVGDHVLSNQNAGQTSYLMVKEFLEYQLDKSVPLVSLILDVPDFWLEDFI